MKTDDEIKAYIAARPGITVKRIHRNLKDAGLTFERIRSLMPKGALAAAASAAATPKPSPRIRPKTLEDFRRAHDNPQKIRNGLASLSDGAYFTEEEFRQFCAIPQNLWRRNAELPEFVDNKFRHVGIVHWANKHTIREMKTITGSA